MKRQSNQLLLALSVVLIVVVPAAALDAADGPTRPPLGFEERLAGVEAIEDVYWSYRIWPEANSTPKPRRDEIMSREQIISKVERSLLLEAALEQIWGERITPERIQLELNRIARNTRHPELLGDVFAALDHDAALIAESFVRPRLVERLVSERYAWDRSIHSELRDRVEAELADVRSVADLNGTTADTFNADWVLVEAAGAMAPPIGAELHLSSDEWNSRTLELAGRFREIPPQGPGAPVPSDPGELLARQAGRGVSPFFETAHHFAVVEILEIDEGQLRIASASWPKVVFSDWLASIEETLMPATPSGGSYTLPKLASGDPCIDDTWMPTAGSGPPSARSSHTAVWTGTEMIVWGGSNGTPIGTGSRYDATTDSWMPISTSEAPSDRYVHTAVWTGSEMIVWGGADLSSALNTGGRYDPATDSWAPVTTIAAPTARNNHMAVWAGTEMIVWGGRNGSTYHNSGGRYDPSTDSWTLTTTTGAPVGRAYGDAVWTGTEMIVWGGLNTAPQSTGGRYDPSEDSWTPTTETGAPSIRYNLVAVWTGTEMIVWGGHNGGSPLNTGGRYDPVADNWTPTSPTGAPAGRDVHVGVWTGTEMIVWGGGNLNTGGVYDPVLNSWTLTTTTGAPSGRSSTSAVWTGTEMIVWGGYDGGRLDTGGRYDPDTDSWAATAATGAMTAVRGHTAVWTGVEMIVWGGYNNDIGFYTDTGGIYDPATDGWTATSTTGAPTSRSSHMAVWTGVEMVVWGGYGGSVLNTGGRYDPLADSWTSTSTSGTPSSRYHHTAVWTGAEMIVWGGYTGSVLLNTGGRYDPVGDSWTATATGGAPSTRQLQAAVWTGSEMIIWGGSTFAGTNTGGLYDPVANSWTVMSTSGAPAGRYYTPGVWTGDEMIVWGGFDGSLRLDTGGRYDPLTDSWTDTSSTDAPVGRSSHTTIWTGEEMILWGGFDDVSALDTGGRYDPVADGWEATSVIGAPPARTSHTSVWAGTGDEMIIWGGTDSSADYDSGSRYCASWVLGIDYGDAPDPTYPTLSASDGARHPFDGVLHLGATVDGESDGQPTASANGDDLDGDDEDGVTLSGPLKAGFDSDFQITASAPGLLNAWIDFNLDGDWDDPGEQVFTDEALAAGINNLPVSVPLDVTPGVTVSRFRLDSVGGLSTTGLAADGEVEDHAFGVEQSAELAVSISDGPDPVIQGGRLSYYLYLGNNGGLDASGVVLTDTLDAEVSFVSASLPACSENAGVVTCTLGDLPAGGSTMVEIEVDVNAGFTGTISNTAIVTLNEDDPVPANNTDAESTTVANTADYIFVDGFETGATDRWS